MYSAFLSTLKKTWIFINYHFSFSFLNATNTQFKKFDDLILILIETGKQLLIYIKKKKNWNFGTHFFTYFSMNYATT